MIRYLIGSADLFAAVDKLDATWRDRALEREKKILKAKKFKEPSSIWSEVKPVFMKMQFFKCAFCERQLESLEYGRIEHDLEHFRPKSAVKAWPSKGWAKSYTVPLGAASATGYYWLAYDLRNYAAACKSCNSPLKSDRFPIAGKRATTKRAYEKLANEKPYLCHPLDPQDDNPQELITFRATTAVPAAASGHKRARGEVIIDFFQLNEREQLHRERARMISILGAALKSIEANIEIKNNRRVVSNMEGDQMPHAGCLRAFRKVWEHDTPLARRIHSACQIYATANDTTPPQFD